MDNGQLLMDNGQLLMDNGQLLLCNENYRVIYDLPSM